MAYNYWKYEYDKGNGSNFRKNNAYKYEDDYESSYLDGYTTSAFSYDESIKRQRLISPQSRSEYGRPGHNAKESYRRRSPNQDYDSYLKQDDSIKKRSKQTKNDQFEIDNFQRKVRKSRSPRRKDEYEDIFEAPEDDYDYDKYFDKSKPKEKKQKKYINEIMSGDDRKSEKQKTHSKKYKDYQVFAYTEPKLHKKVFKSGEKNHSRSHSSSEIEIKTIDYPILAFKENKSQNTSKTSSVFYLPTVYCKDKKSKSHGKTKPRIQSCQPVENQVFAANVTDNKNIFTKENEKHEKNSTNKAVSELKTKESLISGDTKSKHNSNPKISTETQTEETSTFDCKFINKSYRNTGSNVENTELKYKPLRETKETNKYESGKKRNNLFAYQIDIDIEQTNQNLFQSKMIPTKKNVFESKIKPANELCQIEYKHLEDPLQDNYPVTKDYIKVSDNSSIKITPNIISSISHESEKTYKKFQAKKSTICSKRDIISESMHYTRTDSRDKMINMRPYNIISSVDEIVIKDMPETTFRRNNEYPPYTKNTDKSVFKKDLELDDKKENKEKQPESQNPYVFRSKVDDHFENDNEPCNTEKSIKSQNIQMSRSTAVDSGFKNDDETDHREKIIKTQNTQVFRSTLDNGFKNLMTQRSSTATEDRQKLVLKQKSFIGGNVSNISFNRLKYAEQYEDGWNKSKSKNGNVEQEVDNGLSSQPEKTVVTNQGGVPSGVQQGFVQEYGAETSNSNYPLTDKKSKSITRESRWERLNKESVLIDSNSQVVAKKCRNERSIIVFPVMERKSHSITIESKLDKLNNVSTLTDRKSQISIKQSKSEIPSRISHFLGKKSQSANKESKIRRLSRLSNITKDSKENRANNTKVIKNSRFLKTGEQKKAKTILKSVYARQKTIPHKKSENLAGAENIESKRDEGMSLLKNSQENMLEKSETILPKESTIKNKLSKKVISELFFRGKTLPKTEDDLKISTENVMQPSLKKASESENNFRKSKTFKSQESKDIFVKKSVSKLSARSKHKLHKNSVGILPKSKNLSKNNPLNTEGSGILGKNVTSIFHWLAPSQATLKEEKSKQKRKSKPKLLQSQSHERIKSEESKNKSKSKIRGSITRCKSKIEGEPQPTKKELELPPSSESLVRASKEDTIKSEQKTEFINKSNNGIETTGEKSCECITHYVKQAKECGDFFLGTTLHQQVMDLLKVI